MGAKKEVVKRHEVRVKRKVQVFHTQHNFFPIVRFTVYKNVLLWEFFGDLLTYTFLESADLGESKNQCCHLHRHLYGGHFGISKWPP